MQFPIVENFYGLDMLLLAMDTTRDQAGRAPKLLIGEGKPQTLKTHLRFGSSDRDVELLGDLGELLKQKSSEALLDGDRIPREDLGIINRALHQHGVTLTVLGGDPSSGPVRQLLKMSGCRWIPFPPDTEELAQLMGEPALPKRPESLAQNSTLQKPANEHNDPALAEIEAILSQPTGDLSFAPEPGSSATSEDTEERLLSEDNESTQAFMQSLTEAPSPATEAPWFKDQVADLADLVQVIYASSAATQDENGDGSAAANLYTDALRLVQFTRTLGYLASPPARGDAEMDICELAEELLRSAGAATDAPRFMFRAPEPLMVRADKELLIQAMDAILVLSKLCAGPEGTVRLSGERDDEGWASLRLSFPSGPISDMLPEDIVTPYALRSALPDMGRNALRAAARIVAGQGGELELKAMAEDNLSFSLKLPPA